MSESLKNYSNLLKVFAFLLDHGVIKTSYIIGWVDKIIASETESEYDLIELSTTKSTYDIIKILNNNSSSANMEIVCRALLGIIHHCFEDKKLEFKDILIIKNISFEGGLTDDEEFLIYGLGEYSMYDLNNNYRLYRQDLYSLLNIYKDFTLDNHKNWADINEKIKKDIPSKIEILKHKYPY